MPVVGAEVKATGLEGAPTGVAAVSVTVTVHVVGEPVGIDAGEQLTAVVVGSSAANAVAGRPSHGGSRREHQQSEEAETRHARYRGIRSW